MALTSQQPPPPPRPGFIGPPLKGPRPPRGPDTTPIVGKAPTPAMSPLGNRPLRGWPEPPGAGSSA